MSPALADRATTASSTGPVAPSSSSATPPSAPSASVGKIFSPSGISDFADQVANPDTSDDRGRARGTPRRAGRDERAAGAAGVDLRGHRHRRRLPPRTAGSGWSTSSRSSTCSSGVFNLIPLLPLDGGHVAIATYERIRSRKGAAVSRRRGQAAAAHLCGGARPRRARRRLALSRHRSTRSTAELLIVDGRFPRRPTRTDRPPPSDPPGRGRRRRARSRCSR